MVFAAEIATQQLEPLGSASGYAEEIRPILSSLALFEGFSESECASIFDYMACYGAASNTTILQEGDVGDFLIMVLTGRMDVLKADATGESKVVAHILPGGILGEMSLIDGQHRFATCLTREPTDFAVLSRQALNEILVDNPRLGNKLLLILLQLMAQRLREATTRMLPTLVSDAI